ncbi:hypothetical protein [Flammeovirga agarivorans]|uniref:Right handed beta helix domain-containing protein n=1 Tax=Flammeovirga agarivorans TaxID=2726742 RepID=A0A7X8XTT0_9BACT|nr:hypothetical protein [Flammeovirga agarivorans]NLR89658.1 hypothetical protein [Flammeovirga agarivorans]
MKKEYIYTVIIAAIFSFCYSCTPEDEVISTDPGFNLEFSVDTVYFDTLFTSKEDENIDMTSITKRFMVYNRTNNAVNISEISLSDPNSIYGLLINGFATEKVENTFLRGGDSMLILAEANIPYQDQSEILEYNAEVNFFTNGNRQNVTLNAFSEDPFYISGGPIVFGDVVWTKGRPYVIIDSLYIEQTSSLTAEAGTRIIFDNDAKLLVSGSLQLLGTTEDSVRLESIRLDNQYENAPGQWGGIIYDSLSHDNKIFGTFLRNATFGLYIYHPDNDTDVDLHIENSTIQNISQVGVSVINADVKVVNTIISHTISYAYAHASGGNCEFLYNTVVNSNTGFFRERPSVAFESEKEDIQLTFINNIIWGSLSNEFLISEGVVEKSITNNILKTESQEISTEDNLLNQDPYFRYPYSYNFQLADDSPARGFGVAIEGITTDQIGNNRTTPPDVGALQWQEEVEEML